MAERCSVREERAAVEVNKRVQRRSRRRHRGARPEDMRRGCSLLQEGISVVSTQMTNLTALRALSPRSTLAQTCKT